jgi:hypothetical protein
LHLAALRGQLSIVKWLVQKGGADLHAKDKAEQTALQTATDPAVVAWLRSRLNVVDDGYGIKMSHNIQLALVVVVLSLLWFRKTISTWWPMCVLPAVEAVEAVEVGERPKKPKKARLRRRKKPDEVVAEVAEQGAVVEVVEAPVVVRADRARDGGGGASVLGANAGELRARDTSSSASSLSAADSTAAEREIALLRAQLQQSEQVRRDLVEARTCVVCFEAERNCWFVPCGHQMTPLRVYSQF